MIDGGENYDRGCGGCVTMMPSMDAIAEFKTMSGNTGADFGLGSGGNINLIIKSGTSLFHGSAWELFRNDALDANAFFANLNGSPKPMLRQNVFGFNIGGPVWIPKVYNREKNKTFFFVNQGMAQIRVSSLRGIQRYYLWRDGDGFELQFLAGELSHRRLGRPDLPGGLHLVAQSRLRERRFLHDLQPVRSKL
jgi:hypothetical protein